MIELSAGEMVTGASRLVAGLLQIVLLAFGIVAGSQAFGLPSSEALANEPLNLLGWWAPWLGVAVVAVGTFLYYSPPRGAFWWLLVVLYSAWIGQFLGSEALGAYVGGLVGALVMTPVAYAVERRPSGPPALVSFLPAFWLLVPGALGLIGITEYVADNPLYRSLARSLGWLDDLRPIRPGGRASQEHEIRANAGDRGREPESDPQQRPDGGGGNRTRVRSRPQGLETRRHKLACSTSQCQIATRPVRASDFSLRRSWDGGR